ncbi:MULTISPECIES: MFS transporter [Brevibacillus]|uniref:MFS transporter n=1 Tax=Brevibacillus TaxID=55080 RepID=UPI001BA032A6|nr:MULTISPECIES: MFS transporter [Bacillales]MBR8660950.1 MFS transporter [Brevibacillus sp. NL20B1]UFJ63022.1 MFS transporter [Anoxybacillus sediminis]
MLAKQSSQYWALILFSIGVFMAQLDNGIISSALTTINRHFDVSDNWGAWGITIYTLGLAISLPIVGKLSDRYGRKKLFIIEIALFGIGSLLVALSPSFSFYLAARFIQALGGGGIFIIGNSHILSTVEPAKQAKYLGLLGAMNGVAAILGPNIGSFLLDVTGNWHILFLINVPIAIGLFILAIMRLVESSDPSPGRLDLVGTVILSFAILSLMYGLTNIEIDFWTSLAQPEVFGFLGAGIGLFVVLFMYEAAFARKQNGDPILPLYLIKQPRFLLVLVIGALSGGILAAMIFIPGFTENVLGIPAEKSGYWMTPLALASGVGAGLGGALVSKRGPVFTVIISGLLASVGFALFPFWIETKWQFVISSMVAGIGIGVILGAPLNILATEGLRSNKGSALASLSLLRQVGMTIAPTVYAGFIARGYNNMGELFKTDFPDILQDNIAKANLSQQALGELAQIGQRMASEADSFDANQLNEIIRSIQDPALKEVILASVSEVTKRAAEIGYGGLYGSAAVLSVLVILVSLILAPLRKKVSASSQ